MALGDELAQRLPYNRGPCVRADWPAEYGQDGQSDQGISGRRIHPATVHR